MLYIIWTLPALVVVAGIGSGLISALLSSLIGLAVALAVALSSALQVFAVGDATIALGRGAWIGWIVVPYIFGGLLFWQMAIRTGDAEMPVESGATDARARRGLLFTACFLITPSKATSCTVSVSRSR